MAVLSNILTLIIETALATYVATVAWNYRPGRLFVLVIAACAALSAGAILRQIGSAPAALYAGNAARVLGLAALCGALLLLLSALFMPGWWSARRPIRWIALPYGLALLALALDLAAGSGLLVRIGAETAGDLPRSALALAVAFTLGWTVHLGLLIAAYASAPHQRPLISLLFGSLLLAMAIGLVNLRVPWLRDLAGLLETTLLLSILAYIVLNRRLFEPTRVALELALRAMSEIVAVLDPEGKILFANPRARELGLRVDQRLAASQLAAGNPPGAGSDGLARVLASGGVVREPTVLDAVPVGDPPRLLELKLAPIHDRDGLLGGILLLGHDITEIERRNVLLAEEQRRLGDAVRQLGYLATHDPMTDLPNRRSLELELAQAQERAGSAEAVLLFIDLDDFKLVNDSLGHAAGDEVLVAVTKRLATQLRAGDLLARLGGDEFAVLLRDGGLVLAGAVARRMLESVRDQEFALYGQRFQLGLSVGLTAIDQQFSVDDLVAQADLAMYMAKERGGNQFMIYQPNMAGMPAGNGRGGGQQLAERLQQAVGTNQLQLYYQPVVRLADRAVVGHEGLVRLHDEYGALLLPNQFMAAADRFGLMPALDRWIARCAIAALAGRPDAAISINLSNRSLFDPELPQFIADELAAAGVAAPRLSFELAEPVIWQQFERAQSCFERLSALGCGCVIDRVGSSFVSFRTLAELPVSQIKLDGSLCAQLAASPQQQAMLRAMAQFAAAVGKTAVATNIEDEATARLLGELGVGLAQGYCFGSPAPALESSVSVAPA